MPALVQRKLSPNKPQIEILIFGLSKCRDIPRLRHISKLQDIYLRLRVAFVALARLYLKVLLFALYLVHINAASSCSSSHIHTWLFFLFDLGKSISNYRPLLVLAISVAESGVHRVVIIHVAEELLRLVLIFGLLYFFKYILKICVLLSINERF